MRCVFCFFCWENFKTFGGGVFEMDNDNKFNNYNYIMRLKLDFFC